MAGGFKKIVVKGMIWSAFGKFGSRIISFVSNIVLARLLLPSDFGCIGMLHVFIALGDILIVAGFTSAIIQKQDTTDIDCSSVFYWNLVMSAVVYGALFFGAPYIASFYGMPLLKNVLRVQGVVVIINSFSIIQTDLLVKNLKFRELSIRNVICALIGTIVAIVMAFCGCGVWSLVASALINAFVGVILLWSLSEWRPSFQFSWLSLRRLFAFGGLMALSSIVNTIYTELQSLIIGKKYSSSDLGYFTQARALENVPTHLFTSIVNQVSFPVFAKIQNDGVRLRNAVQRNMQALTYIIFPIITVLIVIADPLIHLLYGARWEPAIPYFQILCLTAMIYPINNTNSNIIKSLGKGKVFFIAHLSYRIIGILAILIGVRFGIKGLLWGVVFTSYTTFVISSCINKALVQYGILSQLKDVGVNFINSIVSGLASFYLSNFLFVNQYLLMFIQIVTFFFFYIITSKVFSFKGYYIYKDIILDHIHHKKNHKEQ